MASSPKPPDSAPRPSDSPFPRPPTDVTERGTDPRGKETPVRERPSGSEPTSVDPSESPWPVPPTEGIPFGKDSAEARAIDRILARAEKDEERTAAD